MPSDLQSTHTIPCHTSEPAQVDYHDRALARTTAHADARH
jgi:hypothetical protein